MLIFHVGENCYAIDTLHILRIIPKIELKSIPYAMNFVAGLLNLGGKPVPIIDFCQLIEQRETRSYLNSRIILIKDPRTDTERVLGILGEKIEEIIDLQPEQFTLTEFPLHYFPYLDKVYSDDKRMIQYINIAEFFHFLSAEIFNEHHGF
jgi:chemotaxis-related protein WspB